MKFFRSIIKTILIVFIITVIFFIIATLIYRMMTPKDIAYYIPRNHFKNGDVITLIYGVKDAPPLKRNEDGYRIAWFDESLTAKTSSECLVTDSKFTQYYFYDKNGTVSKATYKGASGGLHTNWETGVQTAKGRLWLKN